MMHVYWIDQKQEKGMPQQGHYEVIITEGELLVLRRIVERGYPSVRQELKENERKHADSILCKLGVAGEP
jgi:hypothetical protein